MYTKSGIYETTAQFFMNTLLFFLLSNMALLIMSIFCIKCSFMESRKSFLPSS